MVKTRKITSIKQIQQLIINIEKDNNINRFRSNYLFRGLPNCDYQLKTSFRRTCKDSLNLEKPLLRNFTKYALGENPQINDSVWYQLSIGQHHGLPTRMMDWTYSPLMALHFAVSEQSLDSMSKHDSVVWAVNIRELNSLLPKIYQDKLNKEDAFVFTVDMLNEVVNSLEQYDKDMCGINNGHINEGHKAMVILEPPSIDQRIISQYSIFSIVPNSIESVDDFLSEYTKDSIRYIISNSIRWEIRDWLDSININERIVYPGLDGLATWLKRHYYVGEDSQR